MKISYGLLFVSFIVALVTSNFAKGQNKLWRFQPGQTEVRPENCAVPALTICAIEYTASGVFVRQINGQYIP